jgi:hypothetical protein
MEASLNLVWSFVSGPNGCRGRVRACLTDLPTGQPISRNGRFAKLRNAVCLMRFLSVNQLPLCFKTL